MNTKSFRIDSIRSIPVEYRLLLTLRLNNLFVCEVRVSIQFIYSFTVGTCISPGISSPTNYSGTSNVTPSADMRKLINLYYESSDSVVRDCNDPAMNLSYFVGLR